MSVKLLNEHHLEFLSIKGGCTGSSESTLVKMPHCWKSRVTAQIGIAGFSYESGMRRRSHFCRKINRLLDIKFVSEVFQQSG